MIFITLELGKPFANSKKSTTRDPCENGSRPLWGRDPQVENHYWYKATENIRMPTEITTIA